MVDCWRPAMLISRQIGAQECRDALQKVLDSDLFTGSRRLTDFFTYAANAALEGRTDLNQYEIADKVLGRASDFHPWDDATVRKLATQVRHKLEEYYAGPGASDRIVISLPRRSYVARFRLREEEAVEAVPVDDEPVPLEPEKPAQDPAPPATAAKEDSPPPKPPARSWPSWSGILLGALLSGLLVSAVFLVSSKQAAGRLDPGPVTHPVRIEIETREGDMRGPELDLAPDAVRTAGDISDGEEAVVQLRFTPESPTQQAGLMAMYDPDNFVRLGPHFKNRTFLEFGIEREGAYQRAGSSYLYDPLGQAGLPRWLAIRRHGAEYGGFLSADGFTWSQFGEKLTLAGREQPPRAAIYAFNGRSSSSSSTAIFRDFGVGVQWHNREEGPFHPERLGRWEERSECSHPVVTRIAQGALEVNFAREAVGCSWNLTRAAPPGDWALTALVDFEAVAGSSAGLAIRGSKHAAFVLRRDLGGATLRLEQEMDRDSRIPDFPGTPPVTLRFEKRGDIVRGSVSRDGENFVPIPGQLLWSSLGANPRVGCDGRCRPLDQPGEPAACETVLDPRVEPQSGSVALVAERSTAPGNLIALPMAMASR